MVNRTVQKSVELRRKTFHVIMDNYLNGKLTTLNDIAGIFDSKPNAIRQRLWRAGASFNDLRCSAFKRSLNILIERGDFTGTLELVSLMGYKDYKSWQYMLIKSTGSRSIKTILNPRKVSQD